MGFSNEYLEYGVLFTPCKQLISAPYPPLPGDYNASYNSAIDNQVKPYLLNLIPSAAMMQAIAQ